MWEITQEYEYQEMVIAGEHFEHGYHSPLSGSQQVKVPPHNM